MDHRDLDAMDRGALVALWFRRFGRAAPPKMNREMLRRILAFELQAARKGGLSARARAELARIARADAAGKDRAATSAVLARAPVPGTRLVREWNGVTHVVEVTADGVIWNGAPRRSLSAVAREITGAR